MSEIGNDSYDLLIVGAGPVGLTLALGLARFMSGARIGILDRRAISVPADKRASAIAAGGRQLFAALGLWPALAEAAEPVTAMRITDSGGGDIARPLFLNFEGNRTKGQAIAHMVPNTALMAALLEQLQGQAELIAPVSVSGFAAGPAAASLTLTDGRVLRAPLVVAADGQNSALRAMVGIGTVSHDYRQSGLVTTIAHELPHLGVAYEHFRPAGPFASLPLAGNRSSLVWTESPEETQRMLGLPEDEVARAIEAVMGSSLGAVTLEDKLQAFPLKLLLARDFVAPRLALVGDAAHVVHPVAGQGLNLGLKDVAALAELVIDAMRLGLDHGGAEVLERYQSWRRFDTALMAAVTDGMNRLFSNDVAPVRAVRDFGLGVVERLPAVKDFLVAQAAGAGGGAPRLLAGKPL